VKHSPALYIAFVVSGVAGLVYEVIWSRYLGLFVGHGAFAQVLVLSVYLGGMAVGALAVSDLSRRLDRPLLGYAMLEAVLGAFGLVFHPLYVAVTGFGYGTVFPALGDPSTVGAVRWALAGLLILPQAVVLGATFPLMAAGLVRADPTRPGGGVARAYLLNTVGGAGGVLLAGFAFIGWFGFAGTSVAAAVLNFSAAGLVWYAVRGGEGTAAVGHGEVDVSGSGAETSGSGAPAAPVAPPPRTPVPRLAGLLFPVAFGTAVASFAYEIGWIRMLSLLLGSATHAFELMLSAFILGLAVGAFVVRSFVDRVRAPLRALGLIQVAMGLAALVSLPVYAASFDVVAAMVESVSGSAGGYALFNTGRYGLALAVMLPATVLAGMTLPLLTATLMRAGAGEQAIGRVYAVNTVGAVSGAMLAGLVALPVLGLKGLIMAGAALDVALGLWILGFAALGSRSSVAVRERLVEFGRRVGPPVAVGTPVFIAVAVGVQLDQTVVTSGVFRDGFVPEAGSRRILYYQDGRTATVSAHMALPEGVTVLSTNGKPDASVGPLWRMEGRDTLPETPIPSGSDFTTQLLSGLVGLAHRPDARNAANIGHGSGITATALLTSDRLERLVTIEIEPRMVEGSLVFLPINQAAFDDPRSSYVFDDAKSFFSYQRERFDLIVTEPSNPWVSGTAGLFTKEFYSQVGGFLTDEGVLVQWMQLYELEDDLFLSVMAALDAAFEAYRVYLVGDADVVIVASPRGSLGAPDWSVTSSPSVRSFTAGIPEIRAAHMEALLLFDESVLGPLLAGDVAANSDFRPILDLGAERARFHRAFAHGPFSFATSPFDLTRLLREESRAPAPHTPVPARGPISLVNSERGAWLREAVATGGAFPSEHFPEWNDALVHLQTFLLLTRGDQQLGAWDTWGQGFSKAATELHWGTTGWTDEAFYGTVRTFLDRAGAPPEARAVVDLHEAVATFDWPRAALAADLLVEPVAIGGRWMQPATLLDAAVLAYLLTGRLDAARGALDALIPATTRAPGHMRHRVLEALVREAQAAP
jgi:spermidine synthase